MRRALIFTTSYMVAMYMYGQVVESPLTNLYTGINVLLFVLFSLIHRWARFSLPTIWGISLVGLGNMLGGVILIGSQPLYVAPFLGPVPFDKVFHAAAAFVLFFVAWEAMTRFAGEGPHYRGLVLMAFLVTMGGGAVVEIAELIGSTIGGGFVNVGDYGNNALDLVSNAVGAAAGTLVLLLARSQARDSLSAP